MPRRSIVLLTAVAATLGFVPAVAEPAGATPPPPTPCVGCWVPPPVSSWQIQLNGTINTKVNASLYEVDLFDTPDKVLAKLHGQGRRVACYFSAGSYENWRPDAGAYPEEVLGRSNGWPGEKWVDIRRLDVLGPIIEARLDLCRARGFDSADADNVDGYTNATGFALTADDQLAFNVFVANAAHERGLSIALKNDLNQIPQLVPYFDWAVNEQCQQYDECALLVPFRAAGKAVMQIEYSLPRKKFCPQANAHDFNALRKRLDLKAWRSPCR
jgi:hypothetical protein